MISRTVPKRVLFETSAFPKSVDFEDAAHTNRVNARPTLVIGGSKSLVRWYDWWRWLVPAWPLSTTRSHRR
jgi:hypothetical protein